MDDSTCEACNASGVTGPELMPCGVCHGKGFREKPKVDKANAFDQIAALVRSDEEDIQHLISDIVDSVLGTEEQPPESSKLVILSWQESSTSISAPGLQKDEVRKILNGALAMLVER